MKIELPVPDNETPVKKVVFDLVVHVSIPLTDIQNSLSEFSEFKGDTDEKLKNWMTTHCLESGASLPEALMSFLWEWEAFSVENLTSMSLKLDHSPLKEK